jgi:DNA primase
MSLPKGYDPDSYVFEFGADAFKKASSEAHGVIGFLTEAAISKHGLTVEGKLAVLEEMKEPLSEIQDPAALSLYAKALGQRLDIEKKAILESIQKMCSRNKQRNKTPKIGLKEKGGAIDCRKHLEAKSHHNQCSRAEKDIVAMMLQCSEILPDIVTHDVLNYFEDENLKSIGEAILLNFDGTGGATAEPSELFAYLKDESQRDLAASLSMLDEDFWFGDIDRKRQLIYQFVEAKTLVGQNELLVKIKNAEAKNDTELLVKLLSKRQKMALAGQERKLALLKKGSSENGIN